MDLDALIAKYLNGECTPDEVIELENRRHESPDHDLKFRRSEEAWHLTHVDRARVCPDKTKTWNNIRKRVEKRYSGSVLIRTASVAASVALIVGLTLAYLFFGNTDAPEYSRQPQQIALFVPAGVSSQITLPDGTVVWLNSSSTIRYPDFFAGETRTVELTGEAFFDVTPDQAKPFIINSGSLNVEVLGTSFNFKHYKEDTHAVLAVETGTVTLSAGTTMTATLRAGKYATVDNTTLNTKVYDTSPTVLPKKSDRVSPAVPVPAKSAIADQFSSWRSNKLVFRDEIFGNVLNDLSRRYNVEFEIQGDEIKDYIYTATFDDMTLEDVLKLLKLSSPIDYTIENLTSNKMNAYGKRKVTITRQ